MAAFKMGGMIKTVLGGVVALGVVGYGWYARKHAAANTTTEMIQVCAGDAACIAAVNTHGAACMTEVNAANPDGPSEVIRLGMVTCINQKTGTPVFNIQ